MLNHYYMHRCLDLAKRGAGYVAPNPMVGAVLLYDNMIIGEGWHQRYGEPHAEVNCIGQAIQNGQEGKLNQSTLFVSLESCTHHGKTPPCTDLIIRHKIPKVIIGCRDPFKEVDGRGIEKLKAAGVETEVGILEKECKALNKRFITFHTLQRPYVVLKWAQTNDGMIASLNTAEGEILDSAVSRLLISNEYTNRLVHKWRSEEAAILVGTNTAILDDPELTNRLWPGPSPVRLVVDMNLRLPSFLKIYDGAEKTIIFNTMKQEEKENLIYFRLEKDKSLVQQIMDALYQLNIQSVLVEGGATLLQAFIDEGFWDEARTIRNTQLAIGKGLHAPRFENALKIEEQNILSDKIEIYKPKDSV